MIDFSNPLAGMGQAETSVNQIARRMADPASDTVSLSADMIALMTAKNSFAIDTKLAQTEDQMMKSALSVFA